MKQRDRSIIEVSALGRLEVRVDGRLVDLGTPRQRAIMAALALSQGRPVPFDALVDRVWGAAPPVTAIGTLQRYVATLRQALEPDRGAEEPPSVVVTSGAAYLLHATPGRSDVDRLHDGVARARTLLSCIPDPLRPAVPPGRESEVGEALDLLVDVLRLWRGEPYADLGDHDGQVAAERVRLQDLRHGAVELRLVALLALGRHSEILGDLEVMTSLHPLHERWWALRAVALLRSERQADALAVLAAVRETLADELGVDPSPPLQALYGDILRQAPSLSLPHQPDPPSAARVGRLAPARPRWPLVGRAREADTLRRVAVDATARRFGIALVTGEAGAGKTRLVQEAIHAGHESGAAVAVGRCSEVAPALWPLLSVVERLGVPVADPDRLHERPADFATWQAVVDGLRRATDAGPVVVVLEDVHRADVDTLRLLEHVVSDRDLPGLTLVLTRRVREGEPLHLSRLASAVARSGGLRLDLAPLTTAEASELALTVDPRLADPEAVARRSGGNPFFVAELALTGGRVGGGLADVVRAQVATLDPVSQTALELASVFDRGFDLDTVASLLDAMPADVETMLEPAVGAGLIRHTPGAGSYEFEHEVVREVLRDGLPQASIAHCRAVADRLGEARPVRRPDATAARARPGHHGVRGAVSASSRERARTSARSSPTR